MGDSLNPSGEGSSLDLVRISSRDGVSIKALERRHFKRTPQFMSELYLLAPTAFSPLGGPWWPHKKKKTTCPQHFRRWAGQWAHTRKKLSTKQIETNDVNVPQFAEQGPSSSK